MVLRLELIVDPDVDWHVVADYPALAAFGAEREPAAPTGAWEMTVRLTDDRCIAEIHQEFFQDASATDVISFPSGDPLDAVQGYLGDVVISVDTAWANAVDAGHSAEREVAFLILHGLLHLCGYDDQTPDEKRHMLERQQQMLEDFEQANDCSW